EEPGISSADCCGVDRPANLVSLCARALTRAELPALPVNAEADRIDLASFENPETFCVSTHRSSSATGTRRRVPTGTRGIAGKTCSRKAFSDRPHILAASAMLTRSFTVAYLPTLLLPRPCSHQPTVASPRSSAR